MWTTNYIEDAATRRVTLRSPRGNFDLNASNYDPPDNGIHLCGVTDDGLQPTTAAVYPMSASDAKRLFDLAKSVAECADDERDFVVDLCIDDSIEEDFSTNRQLWPRAIAAWNAAST